MSEYIWKFLPNAVYLDTDVLRSAGHNLNKPWMSELLSLTNKLGINLCIAELVLEEWCEHLFDMLKSNQQKLLSAIELLKEYNIQTPAIKSSDIKLPEKSALIELVRQRLTNTGFEIIKNWETDVQNLLNEAVKKRPPFENGGKGFCDTIILESYVANTLENFENARIIVVCRDGAIRLSEDRFKKHGINVTFVGETDIVDNLKSLLEDEKASYLEERNSRLREYIISNQDLIIEFVKKANINITNSWLDGQLNKEEEHIYGSIERILAIRPSSITKVIGGVPKYGEKTPSDRYPVLIFVEIEVDIIVRQSTLGSLFQPIAIVQPEQIDENTPLTIERRMNLKLEDVKRTIKRSVTVYATIDGDKEEQDKFEDLNIEKVI